jgi:hypothetical protein
MDEVRQHPGDVEEAHEEEGSQRLELGQRRVREASQSAIGQRVEAGLLRVVRDEVEEGLDDERGVAEALDVSLQPAVRVDEAGVLDGREVRARPTGEPERHLVEGLQDGRAGVRFRGSPHAAGDDRDDGVIAAQDAEDAVVAGVDRREHEPLDVDALTSRGPRAPGAHAARWRAMGIDTPK